jgi:hypothetical protein
MRGEGSVPVLEGVPAAYASFLLRLCSTWAIKRIANMLDTCSRKVALCGSPKSERYFRITVAVKQFTLSTSPHDAKWPPDGLNRKHAVTITSLGAM